jgi:hypothetical protein
MQQEGTSSDQYARGKLAEMRAEVDGMLSQLERLDDQQRNYKTATNTAFTQLAQWNAADAKQRAERQKRLDNELLTIRWALVAAIALQLALLFIGIGILIARGL